MVLVLKREYYLFTVVGKLWPITEVSKINFIYTQKLNIWALIMKTVSQYLLSIFSKLTFINCIYDCAENKGLIKHSPNLQWMYKLVEK